jgi:hypothetical protein
VGKDFADVLQIPASSRFAQWIHFAIIPDHGPNPAIKRTFIGKVLTESRNDSAMA